MTATTSENVLRRAFQFRIRSLLILVVVCSVCTRFGYLSWRQMQDISVIRKNGGKVFFSYQSPKYNCPAMYGLPKTDPNGQSGFRSWCRDLFGPELVGTVEVVYFGQSFDAQNPDLINALNHLNRVKILSIRSRRLADPGFFGELKLIEKLALFDGNPQGSKIPLGNVRNPGGNFDLTAVGKLTRLKTLSLSAVRIGDLNRLHTLKELEELHLPFAQLTDLRPLEKMTRLKWLNFDPSKIEDFSPLAKLTNLRVLRFGLADVPDTTKEEIRRMLPNCTVAR